MLIKQLKTQKYSDYHQKWPKCSFRAPGKLKDDIFWGFWPQILIPHPKKYYICCAIETGFLEEIQSKIMIFFGIMLDPGPSTQR